MPLYSGRACGRPTTARVYIAVACVAAVAKNVHVLVTRGAEYKTVAVCSNGSLLHQTVLDDVCGYPNDQYRVGLQVLLYGLYRLAHCSAALIFTLFVPFCLCMYECLSHFAAANFGLCSAWAWHDVTYWFVTYWLAL